MKSNNRVWWDNILQNNSRPGNIRDRFGGFFAREFGEDEWRESGGQGVGGRWGQH